MSDLNKILIENNIRQDSHLYGTDKEGLHGYISSFYEKEFKKYKDKNINFLEIGTCTGASLLMWRKYFAKAKNIVGVDIADVRKEEYISKDIKYLFGNAYDSNFVNNLEKFDIIIDDGSHFLNDQILTIDLYYNILKKDGLLVIEDISNVDNLNFLLEKCKLLNIKCDYVITGKLQNSILMWLYK